MEYRGAIFRRVKISISGFDFSGIKIKSEPRKRKDFMRKEYIQSGKFYILAVAGLFFRF